MKFKSIGLTALLIGSTLPAFSQNRREITKKPEKSRVTVEAKGNQTIGKFKSKNHQSERVLHDLDQDGWCDIWCALFQNEVEHRSKKTDTDGDGFTDYEEMVLMQNPSVKESIPKALTKAEIAQEKENAKLAQERAVEKMKAFRAELAPFMVNANREAKTREELKAQKLAKRQAKVADFKAKYRAKKAQREAKAKEHARLFNMPMDFIDQNGRRVIVESPDGIFAGRKTTYNASSADTISTDAAQATPFGLTGKDQRIGIWDGANILLNHVTLNGRVTDKDTNDGNTLSAHATHVAGTMISDGTGNASIKGMSPKGLLDSYDFDDDTDEIMTAVSATTNPLNLTNHSYGFDNGWSGQIFFQEEDRYIWRGNPNIDADEDWHFGFYSQLASDVDAIHYDNQNWLSVWACGNDRGTGDEPGPNDHIGHVWVSKDAQGNSVGNISDVDRPGESVANGGYDTLINQAVSKNTLAVGAVNDITGGYSQPSDVVMSNFSCWGPCDDGRIKPDVVANGVSLTSADKDSTSDTRTESGTSMAAPSVTGSINLLREQYEDEDQLDLGDADDVLSSTWKALVIHTADEAGTSPGPDYVFGWGLMNTLKCVNLLKDHGEEAPSLPNVKEVDLPDSDFIEFTVIAKGGEPLKITACWIDPEGTVLPDDVDDTTANLENDLDVRVTDGTNTFYPWKLNPLNMTAPATRTSDNNRDNVEQVLIDNPVAGFKYTVTITHKGTLHDDDLVEPGITPQPVSIIVSGVEPKEAPELQIAELFQTGSQEFTAIWLTVVGDRYQLESSDDLEGPWTVVAMDIVPTKEVTAVPLATGGADRKFWRARRTK